MEIFLTIAIIFGLSIVNGLLAKAKGKPYIPFFVILSLVGCAPFVYLYLLAVPSQKPTSS